MSSPFLFDPTNLLVGPLQIFGCFRHGDWKRAWKRAGIAGVFAEFIGAATGLNADAFFVPTQSRIDPVTGFEYGNPNGYWGQARVSTLLIQKGIKSWAYGYFPPWPFDRFYPTEMYFLVEKRQAHWAQWNLLEAGVPLLHGLIPGSRAIPPYYRTLLGMTTTGQKRRGYTHGTKTR